MTAIAGGMESDGSDVEDCDGMVYSFKTEPKANETKPNSKNFVPLSSQKCNGSIAQNSHQRFTKQNAHHKSHNKKQYPSRNETSKTGNRPYHARRQIADFESSQLFDDLRFAIMQGNLQDVQKMMSEGLFVDTVLKVGWTGLMYACTSGHSDVVAYFLQLKADPNYHANMFTPLMAVCASKKSEKELLKCCKLLLQYGANVNAHERHFTTPLMFAAREGYLLIVKELLENGADPNLQDNTGKTAIAWAACCGHGRIIRLLIEKGADTNILDNQGLSPANLANENGHPQILPLFQKGLITEKSLSQGSEELEPKECDKLQELVKPIHKPQDAQTFVKVGDLELFLAGLELSDCVSCFKQHKLTFHDLLIMNDEELEKIGITQVGARKKILDASKAVHKKEWENSSLPNLKQSHSISCPDAVAMMANVARHLKFISTSVIYIRTQIQTNPRILELSQDSSNVHNLMDEMEDTLKNARILSDDLRFFKQHLERVQNNPAFVPADGIDEVKASSKNKHKLLLLVSVGMATVSVGIAALLWKKPFLFNNALTLIRIKLPFSK